MKDLTCRFRSKATESVGVALIPRMAVGVGSFHSRATTVS